MDGFLIEYMEAIISLKGKQTLSVPVHGRDMKKGLETAILKQAGIK